MARGFWGASLLMDSRADSQTHWLSWSRVQRNTDSVRWVEGFHRCWLHGLAWTHWVRRRWRTADGTLILQGFNSKHTTGGCLGALRQEFRELELLDKITRLRYVGKLPANVSGNTRNDLITSFRSWKGNQYVPSLFTDPSSGQHAMLG